jgi:hypothetical protein
MPDHNETRQIQAAIPAATTEFVTDAIFHENEKKHVSGLIADGLAYIGYRRRRGIVRH